MINVVEEEVEGVDALSQAGLDAVPLRGLHDARHDIERQHALDAGAVAVDVERDAQVDERRVSRLLQPSELAVRQGFDRLDQQACFLARAAIAVEQFVEPGAGVISLEEHPFPSQALSIAA